MSEAAFRELASDAEWEAAIPLLRQLWTDTDPETIPGWREAADYRLFGRYPTDGTSGGSAERRRERPVAVAGVSVRRVLHHARHAWVHDFVVEASRRREGHGAALLAGLKRWARERDCEYLALATPLDNEAALAFYDDCGLERWGYVIETDLG
jgi:GNAT superfamily N-acetyltransferase